jgi:hypothetical protein
MCMVSADGRAIGMWYRVPDPRNVAILDPSALQGWSRAELDVLSRKHRLAILDCLFAEVLMKDRGQAQTLLRKLVGIRCELVESLGAHCTWEVANGEPAGLLLNDKLFRGFPERSAQRAICSLCERTELQHAQFAEDFGTSIDRPNEAQWEHFNSLVLKIHKDTEPGRSVRRAGQAEFLAAWRDALQGTAMRNLIRPHFEAFLNGFRTNSSPPPDAAAMMSEPWVAFRDFVGLLTYSHLNVAANRTTFSHDRLNQRLDLHYLALTGPGMHLVTRDSEMKRLARVISPHSHVIGDPSET